MKRTRIKFCGITRAVDALAASEGGVDALGFVFDARSARVIEPESARQIAAVLPPFVQTVALFRDAAESWVRHVLSIFKPQLLQFHGEESCDYCLSFQYPFIKAVPMLDAQDLGQWAQKYPEAAALLLDSHAPGGLGGTGKPFDWSRIGDKPPKSIVLAGGLNPANVVQAITMARPYAVDVSSGIESAPGIKDPERMREFIKKVRHADTQ